VRHYFEAVSKQMSAQVRAVSASLRHAGMKGASNEEIIRGFLRHYLPGRYALGQGKIVDFSGKESKQVDIIIFGATNAAPLYVDDINIVIPIESVYAVLEVKTTLVRRALTEAVNNILSVHSLDMPEEYALVRGGAVSKSRPRNYYPKGFVLAVDGGRSTSIASLFKQYVEFVRKQEIGFPVIICCAILNEGYFIDVPGTHGWPSEAYLQEDASEDTLLMFFLSLIETLRLMEQRSALPWEMYLNPWGRGKVV
jgi:hypothetical protein